MNFLDLPKNVQEKVFEGLHVNDRVRFNIALPRHQKFKETTHTNNIKDKKLGVLVKSLKTRKVTTLSPAIMCFLSTVSKDDPTIKDICDMFPETNHVFDSKSKYSEELLHHKIHKHLLISNADIDAIMNYNSCDILNALKVTSVEIFDSIYNHVKGKEFFERYIFSANENSFNMFIFSVICHGNVSLLEHILEKINVYGQTLKGVEEYMNTECIIILLGARNVTRQIMFKHFHINEDLLDKLYCHLVENMNIDSALEVEKYALQKKKI